MKFLRKKGVMKVLLWGIAIVVILSFGILSNAYLLNKNPNELKYAGKIFGKKVSVEDFERNYQFVVIQAQLQYGQNFQQVAPMLDLEKQTWDRIILLKKAEQQHIKVSDNDVITYIRRMPFFFNQTTQTFDPKIYQMVINRGLRTTTRAFEEGIRDSLKISRLFEHQTFAVTVTDADIINAYKKINEKIRVSYVLFPAADFLKDVVFDEIQAKNYFLTHKKDFIQPPAINILYVSLPFKPENEESKSQAYDKAFNLLSSLRNGEDFPASAGAHNIKIRETGFFDAQKPDLSIGWPLETFQELLSMRPGQYSEIITTDNSYDIFQLREVRPPFLPPYEQAADEVRIAWQEHKALELSERKAREIRSVFQPNKDFGATAKEQKLTAYQTPDFHFGQYLTKIGLAPAFQQTAFSLTADEPLSGVVETEKGYTILHLDERIPVDLEKFDEEKDAFGQRVLMQKKMEVFDNYIKILKHKADLKDLISERLQK